MYCSSCGKEINDTAGFCPYCGARKAAGMPEMQAAAVRPEMQAAVRPVPVMNNTNENEVLPVYKRKEKAAFLVAFVPLIGIFLKTVITLFLYMFMA